MQSYPSIETIIKNNASIKQAAAADLEWNWNGIAQVDSLSLNGTKYYEFDISEGDLKGIQDPVTKKFVYDEYLESLFPLRSIINFLRPGEYAIETGGRVGGIAKARVNSINSIFKSPTDSIRNYVSSSDSYYQYWSSKNLTNSTGTMNETIEILYDRTLDTNKIVIKFETSSSIPKTYTISGRRSGTWQTLFTASNTPLTNGGLILYWNGSTWTTTAPTLANHLVRDEIDGIRLNVTAVNFKDAADKTVSLEVIEISPRLITDITDNVISWDTTKTIYEPDTNNLPVGLSSTNTATLKLENTDNRFNNTLSTSSFYGLLEQNVKVRIYAIIEGTKILQFTGYVDEWEVIPDEEATVSARDISKFLQQIQAPDLLLGAPTNIGQVVRTILDSAGFNELIFKDPENLSSIGINYFWSTSDKTILEALQDVCYVHQCALYVDEFGQFNLETRKNIYNVSTSNWTFRYNKEASHLSDIFETNLTNIERIGKVKVFTSNVDYTIGSDNLTMANFIEKAIDNRDNPKLKLFNARTTLLSNLWEPTSGSSVTLGAFPLVKRLEVTDTEMYVNPSYLFPFNTKSNSNGELESRVINAIINQENLTGIAQFSGYLLINDEILYYDGIEFEVIYGDGRPQEKRTFKTFDEFANAITIDPQIKYLLLTGVLKNIKRGEFGTTPRAHDPISPDNGAFDLLTFNLNNGSVKQQLTAPTFNIYNTKLDIKSSARFSNVPLVDIKNTIQRRNFMTISTATLDRSDYERFETTVSILNLIQKRTLPDLDSIGGMAFNLNTGNMSGYYVQIQLNDTAETRNLYNSNLNKTPPAQVILFRYDGSSTSIIGSANEITLPNSFIYNNYKIDENNKEQLINIFSNVFYNIQVVRKRKGSKMYFNVYINSQLAIEEAVDNNPLPNASKIGLFTRGDSKASFDYVAAWGIPSTNEELTSTGSVGLSVDSMLGYYSEAILSSYFQAGSKSIADYVKGKRFDFYPFAKEIRIIDAKFSRSPAAEVFLHLGPVSNAFVDYAILYSSPFRIKFLLLNEAKRIVDFSISLNNTGSTYPKVFGYVITQQGKKEIEKNTYAESMVPNLLTIDSPWVQGKNQLQAEDLANFILRNSGGYDTDLGYNKDPIIIDCEVVSNPLLQTGDIVKIEDPTSGLSSSTNSFIITSINQSFNDGLTTRLVLREVF